MLIPSKSKTSTSVNLCFEREKNTDLTSPFKELQTKL